ncbi:Aldehyde/histidinol dehydrogenase [Pilobolus umbonatus]|nr:Aldehyde/histidinol dehydrogenase [Pilobolus umbonatus]
MSDYTPIDQIPGIVESLQDAFNKGISKDIQFRKQQLSSLRKFCLDNNKLISEALWKDLHKSQVESDTAEISPIVDECQYMLSHIDSFIKPTYTSKRFIINITDKTYIRKEPKGVVLVIEVAVHTADIMCNVLTKYLDSRVCKVITGGVEETTALLRSRFDHIFYTGNGQVGKIIMTAAANQLTPVTLELGGKSPAFVTPDADLNITAHRLIWGKLFNAGQTCIAPDYALVTKENVEPLLDAMRHAVTEFYGQDPQNSSSYGRIINHRQFDRLKSLLDSCDKSIVIGGKTDRDDLYIAPTVMCPVDPNTSQLMQHEIFGPILPIIPVDDMDQAIAIVNARDHPLALYVFSGKKYDYNHILNHTRSGGVCVNDVLMHLQELSLPFGGVGASGMGNYHGEKSFETFTHQRSTMVKSVMAESLMSIKYPPYDSNKQSVLGFLVYGLPAGFMSKIKSLTRVCGSYYNYLFKKERTDHDLP